MLLRRGVVGGDWNYGGGDVLGGDGWGDVLCYYDLCGVGCVLRFLRVDACCCYGYELWFGSSCAKLELEFV